MQTDFDFVRDAIEMEWPAMEARRPTLAALLDREAVVRGAAEHLAAHPDYRRSLAEADEAGMGPAAAAHVARSFVQDWLARLPF
jgi:hypothetical protein